MFCRCELEYFAPREHADVPGLPRASRRAAGAEPAGDRDGRSCSGSRSAAEIAERAIFHRKNYFYPDNPKGYQISQYDEPLCVDGQFARARRPTATRRGRDRARAPRGGRGEERPRRRRRGPHPRRRPHAGRLQPRRDAARRDRRPRPDIRSAERREALPPAAAADRRRARHLGRRDGEGLAALRRQRLGPAGGLGRASHAHRAEEHELVQLRGARGSSARSSGRSRSTSRAERSSRRRCTSTPATSRRRRCARRRRRRTTATSRSPTSCRSSRRPRAGRARCARSSPSSPATRIRRLERRDRLRARRGARDERARPALLDAVAGRPRGGRQRRS